VIRYLVQIFCAILVGAAGVYAGLGAWARIEASRSPQTVLGIFPDNALALLTLAENSRRAAGGAVSDDVRDFSQHLLHRSPLADAPLVYAGIEAMADGDRAKGDKAFTAVLARSPRNTMARIWLAQRAIEAGDYSRAIEHLDRLIAINYGDAAAYIDVLAGLGQLPEGAAALGTRVGASPAWGEAVVRRLNNDLPDYQTLLQLNVAAPGAQPAFLQRLVREQGVELAFIAWLSFLPPEELAGLQWPYDATFEGRPAPEPFNWSLQRDQAELTPGGGLYVTYQGRGRPVLASQTILLGPGLYRFEAEMDGSIKDSGGGLAWALQCLPSAQELAAVKAVGLNDKPRVLEFDFTVPGEACSAQKLILRGDPGEFPLWARVTVHRVAIKPGNVQPVALALTPTDVRP